MTIRCRFEPRWLLLLSGMCCLWDRRMLLLGLPIAAQATMLTRGSILRLTRGPHAAASRGPTSRTRRIPLATVRAICVWSSAGVNPSASACNTACATS